jgi:hypothetical protein
VKIRIVITDETGREYEGETELVPTGKRSGAKPPRQPPTTKARGALLELDFDLPLRPFLKAYSKGRSGSAKFTLLLAHFAKGKADVPVRKVELEQAWNRVTAHLGSFNPAHTTRARDRGWVDSPKKGEYVLRPNWVAALAD